VIDLRKLLTGKMYTIISIVQKSISEKKHRVEIGSKKNETMCVNHTNNTHL